MQSDPPLTAQYRRTLHHVFSVPAVRELEPNLREWATQAIDSVIEQGHCDIARDLARPLPGKVTMGLMGWPLEDWQQVLDPLKQYTGHAGEEPERQEGAVGVAAIRRRVTENLVLRRREPGDDLVSDLVGANVDGRPLSDEEIIALAMMVIFGGIDTTVAAIGNMLVYLDSDRELRTRLIEDSSLIPVAVDELLRYEPPVQGFARFLREDVTVRAQTAAQGREGAHPVGLGQ